MSIIISACTTGLASATISYDFDTDPLKRLNNPEFYGYCPDEGGGRLRVFLLLFLNSTLHILGKTLSAALLATIDAYFLWAYLGVDMALFLTFRVVRCDFFYWFPFSGLLAFIVSLFMRIFQKIVVDFTACVHFRHPVEMGGFYWTFNLVLSQLSVFGATILYTSSAHEAVVAEDTSRNDNNTTDGIYNFSDAVNASNVENKTMLFAAVDPSQLWTIVGCISALWFFSFTAFIFSIKSEYIKTFSGTLTGAQYSQNYFLDNEDDESKRIIIFTTSEYHWKPIREDVKSWVQVNWYQWEEEKPAWWTDAVKGSIPNDMLPAPALKEEEKKGGGVRRRSSLGEVLAVTGGSAEVVPASQ